MSEVKFNALNSIARRCNEEMKKAGKDNIKLLTEISSRYAEALQSLGFTKIDLLAEIGVINGRLTSKRNEY